MKEKLNKKVINEFDKTLLGIDIMLYTLIAVVGYILLRFSEYDVFEPITYASPIFFMFGFFAVLAYFLNRRENDYEHLIFGAINIITATFILINTSYPNSNLILGNAILIYSIANVLNKAYHSKKLLEEENIAFIPKLAITLFLTLFGILVVSCLYDRLDTGTLIFGYYFILFGLLSLFEPLLAILFRNPTINKEINRILGFKKAEEPRKRVKIKEYQKKKPISNEKVGTIEKREKSAKKITKK